MTRNIFDQTDLGGISMKNRLIRSATWENLADEDGSFDERLVQIYKELAEGGSGLIITGFTSVSEVDADFGGIMRLSRDQLIPEYQKLVKAVKAYDCPIISQLALGSYMKRDVNGILKRIEITDMNRKDIVAVTELFSDAALRAQRAGFDGGYCGQPGQNTDRYNRCYPGKNRTFSYIHED